MKTLTFISTAVLFLTVLNTGAQAQMEQAAPRIVNAPTDKVERDGPHTWIERPWKTRYFLHVENADGWASSRKLAIKRNRAPTSWGLDWEEFFDPGLIVTAKPHDIWGNQDFAVVSVEFDQQGFVTTKNTHPGALRGRLNRLLYITLSAGDEADSPLYDLGLWFTGLGDVSTDWAPGLCKGDEVPNAALVRSDIYLYGRLFKATDGSTTFGCREWAYQLYDDERPYIDVTSYVPKGQLYPDGSYIREFIGWARFGDKKPVIGKHEDRWYCLYDCPNNELAGHIPDIKSWAQKNGWAVPKRPKKMPVFPDPPTPNWDYPK